MKLFGNGIQKVMLSCLKHSPLRSNTLPNRLGGTTLMAKHGSTAYQSQKRGADLLPGGVIVSVAISRSSGARGERHKYLA